MVKHPRQNKRSFGSDSLTDISSNPITLNFFHKEKKTKKGKIENNDPMRRLCRVTLNLRLNSSEFLQNEVYVMMIFLLRISKTK